MTNLLHGFSTRPSLSLRPGPRCSSDAERAAPPHEPRHAGRALLEPAHRQLDSLRERRAVRGVPRVAVHPVPALPRADEPVGRPRRRDDPRLRCGPGDDVTGFLLNTEARRVFGADISETALGLTASRLDLHDLDPKRYRLLQLSDAQPELPLDDASVDYVHCGGVIQHTTTPELVLRELARVLRPGAQGRIMVYNRDSLYFHLYTAYTRRVLEGSFAGLTAEEAFARNTDGPECPISRAFRPAEFCELAERAGFEIEFLGGYYADLELDLWRDTGTDALAEPRLADEHKEFLRGLTNDPDGYPRFEGRFAGVGGVYRVTTR